MTRILRSKRFEKDLDRVPEIIQMKVIDWIEFIETLGIREVRRRSGYHDESLKGNRMGQRSVRLNRAYRLIYKEMNECVEILLLEVNKHEY